MILIVSSVSDESTNRVVDWLDYYSQEYVIINQSTFENEKQTIFDPIHPFSFFMEKKIKSDKMVTWFRRIPKYRISELDNKLLFNSGVSEYDYRIIVNDIHKENNVLQNAIWRYLDAKSIKVLSSYRNITVNKLEVLRVAVETGLTIPKSILSNSKTEVANFFKSCDNGIITKSMDEGININIGGVSYNTYTEIVDIANLPEQFSMSLFQERVDKRIELRIFYLDNQFYSMAIFSQLDLQTSIDFRRYNTSKGNRTVPFKLPSSVKNKLLVLLERYNMNTASIDMIKDKKGNFIFLEINPVGQYNMTSSPCNYYLDKKIANFLMNEK